MKNKKEIILSVNPCTYGLNYHDPAAMIISDGKILFGVEEERLNGIKGSKGLFPQMAINECLKFCNISKCDITGVAIGYDPALWGNRLQLEMEHVLKQCKTKNRINAIKLMKKINECNLVNRYLFFKDNKNVEELLREKIGIDESVEIKFYEHHMAHIASAYEVSGFDEAVGVVVDGIGETTVSSVWKIKNHNYEKILDIQYPNSLGYFYAIATKFLGFTPWEHEGKTMALAAYGRKDPQIWNKLMQIINLKGDIYDVTKFINDNSSEFLMADENKAISSLEKLLGFPARKKDEPLNDNYKNFAWAIQEILETSVINLVNYAIKQTGIYNVCVAGGVFMNCKMNMVLRENSNAKNLFVQPLAGDGGLTIGAGLLMSKIKFKGKLNTLAFGPYFNDQQIEQVLKDKKLKYIKSENIAKDVANLIANGKIVCWMQGGMEMGARALGSRSILADPRLPYMSDKINEIVKHRESWRPFACSVLEEHCKNIFENYNEQKMYPFMIEAFRVKPEWKDKIPSVIHKADSTSRPQTVNKNTHPLYYKMISEFYNLTRCPLVLNTSFNDKGQPIIVNPKLAIEFYEKIQVDAIAMGNFIVER